MRTKTPEYHRAVARSIEIMQTGGRHLVNMSSARNDEFDLRRTVNRFYMDEGFFLESLITRQPLVVACDTSIAMRETVRLYGEYFGIELLECAPTGPGMFKGLPYASSNYDLGDDYYSLWTLDKHANLSLFWRLYEYHLVETAKS